MAKSGKVFCMKRNGEFVGQVLTFQGGEVRIHLYDTVWLIVTDEFILSDSTKVFSLDEVWLFDSERELADKIYPILKAMFPTLYKRN